MTYLTGGGGGMTYIGRENKKLLLPSLGLLFVALSADSPVYLAAQAIFVVLFLFSMCIAYTLQIKEDGISYRVMFFAFPLYKREVSRKEITGMKFARYGFSQKGAVIRTKSCLGLRIINFTPDDVYQELMDYADENEIEVVRTRDFEMLARGQK